MGGLFYVCFYALWDRHTFPTYSFSRFHFALSFPLCSRCKTFKPLRDVFRENIVILFSGYMTHVTILGRIADLWLQWPAIKTVKNPATRFRCRWIFFHSCVPDNITLGNYITLSQRFIKSNDNQAAIRVRSTGSISHKSTIVDINLLKSIERTVFIQDYLWIRMTPWAEICGKGKTIGSVVRWRPDNTTNKIAFIIYISSSIKMVYWTFTSLPKNTKNCPVIHKICTRNMYIHNLYYSKHYNTL